MLRTALWIKISKPENSSNALESVIGHKQVASSHNGILCNPEKGHAAPQEPSRVGASDHPARREAAQPGISSWRYHKPQGMALPGRGDIARPSIRATVLVWRVASNAVLQASC